jgi:hypothetical protein
MPKTGMVCLPYDVQKKPRARPEETAESAETAENNSYLLRGLSELRGSI